MKNKKNLTIISIVVVVLAITSIIILITTKTPKNIAQIIIDFDTDGAKEIAPITINTGETIELPIITKEGYIFGGWYLNHTKVTNKTIFNEDTTLKAYWISETAKTYKMTFDTSGGTELEPLIIECDSEFTLPANPTKDNYIFDGWEDKNKNSITNETKLACEDITLIAKWKEKEKKKEEEKQPEEKKQEYTCPEGYTLNETQCTTEKAVNESCPGGYQMDADICVLIFDYTAGTRTCPSTIVSINDEGEQAEVNGEYSYNAGGYCGYSLINEYSNEEACNNAPGDSIWYDAKCYRKIITNNYQTVCSENYRYYTAEDIINKFGDAQPSGCYGYIDKIISCLDEDYILKNNRCIKTIDATIKE